MQYAVPNSGEGHRRNKTPRIVQGCDHSGAHERGSWDEVQIRLAVEALEKESLEDFQDNLIRPLY